MRTLCPLGVLVTLFASSSGCGGESDSAPSTSTAPATVPATSAPATTEPATTESEVISEPVAGEGLDLSCTVDADCVIAPRSRCCASCCHCPTVMTRARSEHLDEMCRRVRCGGPACDRERCEPCGIITAARCVEGRCSAS